MTRRVSLASDVNVSCLALNDWGVPALSIGQGFKDQHATMTKTWGITAHQ